MKGGQQSSKAPRGDMRTVVIEDIKGNTTITRVMGTNISHNTSKYPNRGRGTTFTPLGRYIGPQHE